MKAIILMSLLPQGGFKVEKLKDYFKNYFSNGPKAIFIVVLVMLGITISVSNQRKVIEVSIDGKQSKIVTFRSTLRRALVAADISVGPKDKTSIGLDNEIKDGDKINIKRAVKVSVYADGKQFDVLTADDNVADMLADENVGYNEDDKVAPSAYASIKPGMQVVVTRYDEKVVKSVKPIDYATEIKKDDNMEKGAQKVIQEGESGEKLISEKVLYEDGKEVGRYVISETIKKLPIQKIVAMGTLGVYTPSRGGKVLYRNSLRMKSTAYSADYLSTGKYPGNSGYGITATGTVAKRNSSGYSSVAVDPRIIPLGTKLYIDGYGYAVAEDIGGAIKGNKIDLYFNGEGEVYNWGVRWVDVYILK